jgi:prepilin-type N-terminal cleavage/methylation domain-containing protein
MTRRRGFTVLEVVTVMALLTGALAFVAQIGVWCVQERVRGGLRQEVDETAANVMESARACPWEDLTKKWAEAQHLPEALARRLGDGRLTVQVEPEPSRQHVKRVTVEITWKPRNRGTQQSARLVGLFSARSAGIKGTRP